MLRIQHVNFFKVGRAGDVGLLALEGRESIVGTPDQSTGAYGPTGILAGAVYANQPHINA